MDGRLAEVTEKNSRAGVSSWSGNVSVKGRPEQWQVFCPVHVAPGRGASGMGRSQFPGVEPSTKIQARRCRW